MRSVFAGVALVSGVALAFQVGCNNQLRARLGHPIPAALTSFAIGTTLLAIYAAAARPPWPKAGALAGVPWWAWLGGALGAAYVTSAAAFATRLGAATWLGLIVTGQILASLALDHFGLLGFPTHPISAGRLVGAALLLIGVVLVLRS